MNAEQARDIRWGIRIARNDRRRIEQGYCLVGNVSPQILTRRDYAREWVRKVPPAASFEPG